jgi:CDP-6-deoxy-D-xylo-4-hexulose-3-dehydrase
MTSVEKNILPLATSSWGQDEYDAIQRVVASDRFTMGPAVKQFEADFAARMGTGFAVMVNSGSSANLIAVASAVLNPEIDLNPGDEVLVPAVSWATTYYPLQQYGLKLRFVDINPETLNMDLSAAAAAITNRTKAVFAVNLLGNPNNFDELGTLTKDAGMTLLEDNCESMGAKFKGREAGTFGLAGTYSTFFSHHIATMEGGLVCTNDERTYQTMLSLRAHGWTRDLPEQNFIFNKTGDSFDDAFRFVLPGYNLRPVEMSGAIGIEQIKRLSTIVEERRKNASHWMSVMSRLPGVRIQKETGESSWFGFSMVFREHLAGRRREVVSALQKAGVETRPIVAGNFAKNPAMSFLEAVVPDALPHADEVHAEGLFIGNHHFDVRKELDIVAEVISSM